MSKCKGTVKSQGKGKFSFYVTLEENDGFYFNTKFEPKCGVGDVVGIEYEPKGDKRGNVKRIEILTDNGGPKGVQKKEEEWGKSGGAGGGGGNRQDSIVFQSSRKDALVLVGVLLSNEAFATKGKPDAKRVQIEELVDEVTARFFNDATDPRKSAVLTANAEIDADAGCGAKDEWGGDETPPDEWED